MALIAKRACGKMKGMRIFWDTFRPIAMRKILKTEFDQNYDLKSKLIETYPNLLVEYSPYGNFWGDRHENGLN